MIEQALICSAIITCIHVCTWDGMIAGKLRSKYLYRLPLLIRKPLYECLICMCSVWGTAYYLTHFDFIFWQWIEFVFIVGGINTLVYGVVGNAEDSNGEEFVKKAEELYKRRKELMNLMAEPIKEYDLTPTAKEVYKKESEEIDDRIVKKMADELNKNCEVVRHDLPNGEIAWGVKFKGDPLPFQYPSDAFGDDVDKVEVIIK